MKRKDEHKKNESARNIGKKKKISSAKSKLKAMDPQAAKKSSKRSKVTEKVAEKTIKATTPLGAASTTEHMTANIPYEMMCEVLIIR